MTTVATISTVATPTAAVHDLDALGTQSGDRPGITHRHLEPPFGRPQHQLADGGGDGPQQEPVGDPAVGERPVALAHADEDHPEHRHQKQDPARPVDPRAVVAAYGLGAGARAVEGEGVAAGHHHGAEANDGAQHMGQQHDVVSGAVGQSGRGRRHEGTVVMPGILAPRRPPQTCGQ